MHQLAEYPYMVQFRDIHNDFHLAEFNSLLLLFGVDPSTTYDVSKDHHGVFFLPVKFPSLDIARNICSRSILIKCIVELWGVGADEDSLHDSVTNECPKGLKQRHIDSPWSLGIDAYGLKFKASETVEKRERFLKKQTGLFEGKVSLSDPDANVFVLIEDYGNTVLEAIKAARKIKLGDDTEYVTIRESKRIRKAEKREKKKREHDTSEEFNKLSVVIKPTSQQKMDDQKELVSNVRKSAASNALQGVYFGRLVGKGRNDLVDKYSLKKRSFLGPTSMDNELSFIMANQGLVRAGSLVLDPFVGTGSILIPPTILGAVCQGVEIDSRILERKEDKHLFDSFDQYDIPRPDILRMDFSPLGRGMRNLSIYDAILCDPPYGIRAGARKVGRSERKKLKRPLQENLPKPEKHCTPTQGYDTVDVVVDMLDAAARLLKVNGRLVYLLPFVRAEYTIDSVPVHPCLVLVANSEQLIAFPFSRRLITMEKTAVYDDEKAEEYTMFTRTKMSDAASAISGIKSIMH